VSDAKKESKGAGGGDYRIPEGSSLAGAWKVAAAVGAIGVLMAGAGLASDPRRFGFAYLMGFMAVLTMSLGSIFFVLIQHLTFAGWSVTVRRTAEFFVAGVVVLPILFLPNLMSLSTLYPWWSHGGDHVAHAQEAIPVPGGPAHAVPAPASGDPAGRRAAPPPPAAHGVEAQAHEHGAGDHGHEHGAGDHGHEHGAAAGHGDHAAGHGHDPEHAAHAKILAKKEAFLNPGFFGIRLVIYFLVWLLIATRLFKLSTEQDKSGDPALTLKLQRFAPAGIILFALSLTFAGFDWVMSLEPAWFSTMFGVRIFASSAVLGLALVILLSMAIRNAGVVKDEINVEHYHDLGKLMFGFLVFWAYISFSEFMLIWYAAIPEETVYYHHRWDFPTWRAVSISIVVVKFIIPFFLVMSRNIKRRLPMLRLGAAWIAGLHLVEMYYWIMPYYYQGELEITGLGLVTDLGCFMACIGIYLAVVFKRMLNHPVIPVKDPRLERALHFVNA